MRTSDYTQSTSSLCLREPVTLVVTCTWTLCQPWWRVPRISYVEGIKIVTTTITTTTKISALAAANTVTSTAPPQLITTETISWAFIHSEGQKDRTEAGDGLFSSCSRRIGFYSNLAKLCNSPIDSLWVFLLDWSKIHIQQIFCIS